MGILAGTARSEPLRLAPLASPYNAADPLAGGRVYTPTMSKKALALALALPLLCCQQPDGEAKKPKPAPLDEWKEVDKLVGEQKLEAASAKLDALREKAQKENREDEW